MKVLVRCSTGYECTVPVAGPWKLDTKNKRYTNSASASNLPSNVRDKKGLLIELKNSNPELFKNKFKAKFGADYNE